jgi:hypothetical protein
MKSMLALSFVLAASAGALAQSDSVSEGARLVEAIAKEPDIYHQSCMGRERDPKFVIEARFSGATSDSQHEISSKQFAELRKHRAEAIEALGAWLKAGTPLGDEKSYANPRRSRILMTVDLNASELIPQLVVEAKRLQKEWDEASKATEVDWKKVAEMPDAEKKGIYAKVDAGERLGDVLSAIVSILRQEKFAPLVTSDFEKDAEAKMKEKAKESWFKEIAEKIEKNGGQVEGKDRDVIVMDPVLEKPISPWTYPTLVLSAADITKILGWAEEFAKLPADKRLGEKGMTSWPVNR